MIAGQGQQMAGKESHKRQAQEPEARHSARLEFGGIDQVKECVGDVHAGIGRERFLQDLNYGVRVLRRSPGFTVAAILVLSLAIGANTAMFSVIEAVLLRPLPYKDPERLCVVWKSIPHRNIEWDWTSALTVMNWRDQSEVMKTWLWFCARRVPKSR